VSFDFDLNVEYMRKSKSINYQQWQQNAWKILKSRDLPQQLKIPNEPITFYQQERDSAILGISNPRQ
jgi:hypothetical protein